MENADSVVPRARIFSTKQVIRIGCFFVGAFSDQKTEIYFQINFKQA